MTHISRRKIDKEVWEKVYGLFLEGIARAKTKEEANIFVGGFLTPTERIMLAKRFAIFFLREKGVEARQVKETLNVTFSTISKIDLWRQSLGVAQKRFIAKILLRKEMVAVFKNLVKGIYFMAPPKGVDWQRWGREKFAWEKEKGQSL